MKWNSSVLLLAFLLLLAPSSLLAQKPAAELGHRGDLFERLREIARASSFNMVIAPGVASIAAMEVEIEGLPRWEALVVAKAASCDPDVPTQKAVLHQVLIAHDLVGERDGNIIRIRRREAPGLRPRDQGVEHPIRASE